MAVRQCGRARGPLDWTTTKMTSHTSCRCTVCPRDEAARVCVAWQLRETIAGRSHIDKGVARLLREVESIHFCPSEHWPLYSLYICNNKYAFLTNIFINLFPNQLMVAINVIKMTQQKQKIILKTCLF